MKVGTDGTLLGAWAAGGHTVLDIGTGTGLVALMMAQRFPHAAVTAIDIDADACLQARSNAECSPFARRVRVINMSLQQYMPLCSSTIGRESPRDHTTDTGPQHFDAIVCNPPYYSSKVVNNDARRTLARNTSSLPYSTLFAAVSLLLAADGQFSAIIPSSCRDDFEREAVFAGLCISRQCDVSTVPSKAPSRHLLTFTLKTPPSIEHTTMVIGDRYFSQLTKDFYLVES